jgi:hypothetical protein
MHGNRLKLWLKLGYSRSSSVLYLNLVAITPKDTHPINPQTQNRLLKDTYTAPLPFQQLLWRSDSNRAARLTHDFSSADDLGSASSSSDTLATAL